MYQKCFEILFKHVSQCTQKEVRWKHLHYNGFVGITVDMDGKQMSGRSCSPLAKLFLTCSIRLWQVPPVN